MNVQVPLKSELNETEVAIGRKNKKIAIVNVTKGKPCECGCNDIAIDNFHGETFCPDCGLIQDIFISI